jgi:hypothetical protein
MTYATTYVNHRDTEVTKTTQSFFLGLPFKKLCAFSVCSVPPWLAYGDE